MSQEPQQYTFTNGIPIPVGGFKKERIALTLNGEKIGNAEISNSGLLTALVNAEAVAKLPIGNIESLSITVNTKE
ncbi:hypothetical protein QCN32_gp57 [Arthrobacter phage Niktson]|uniref:Uncharacterized protein n=1 Tax=Arthrobacter phage Niktson TaxID=2014347 RepID=A0A218M5P6_9CAUD|nr:hypothetical protein QCN32_gp57 [Arthrobacter phage Niktson]ASD52279.1 hypothetical protein NIKTSON_57 [Arthrobacter phage Niktson]ASD52373.1 hypothetical protein ELEPHANTMAN_57 [Arthrobacter phage ElephantMan]